MTILYAMLLGIVQGITEFLPVSSTGHLVILRNLISSNLSNPLFWDIFLHFGTTLAVSIYYSEEISTLTKEAIHIIEDCIWNIRFFLHIGSFSAQASPRFLFRTPNRKLLVKIFITMIPTGLISVLAGRLVIRLEKTTLPTALGFFVTGLFLLVADRLPKGKKTPRDLNYAQAVWLGICQGIALFPGISRQAITITLLIIFGVSRKHVVKYSFLVFIPTMWGALLLELLSPIGSVVSVGEGVVCVFGSVIAGVAGYLCIPKLLMLVRRRKLRYFSYYCLLAGVVAAAVYFLH